jgi:ABC-type multidrug transport system fused ATPase/permease subunit
MLQKTSPPWPTAPLGTPPAVVLDGVWLRYGSGLPWVLKGLTLRIPRGAKVALVGRTGSGKTSVVSALMQLYPVQSGTLRVGAVDLARMRPELGRQWCTALLQVRSDASACFRRPLHNIHPPPLHTPWRSQDGTLFTGTVRDNLIGPAPSAATSVAVSAVSLRPSQRRLLARMQAAQGQPVSDDAVWAALDAAGNLSHRIRALPGGLDAPVAEYGGNFSVGERALLCLARLLLRLRTQPPPVVEVSPGDAHGGSGALAEHLVVADEPTASVDAVADAVVHNALLSLPNTLVCVCHRLHHVPRFDLVAVVQAGVCVEVGPPAALLRQPGSAFAALVGASAAATAAVG